LLPFYPWHGTGPRITVDNTVKEGEALDQNLFLSGQDVVMDGSVNGDLVAVGNNVTINGEVKAA